MLLTHAFLRHRARGSARTLCGRDSTGTPKPSRLKVGYILCLTPDIIAATSSDIYVLANNEIAVIDNQSALLRNGINDPREQRSLFNLLSTDKRSATANLFAQ